MLRHGLTAQSAELRGAPQNGARFRDAAESLRDSVESCGATPPHRTGCNDPRMTSGYPPMNHAQNGSRSNVRRSGFTVLELLTVMGIVSTLAAIVLPAVGSAREAARRMQCVNQLKQVGIALHGYHESCGSLPSGWQWEGTQQSAYGWAVPLLPWLEQNAIYEQTNRNVLLTHPDNTQARATSIGLLLCPSDIAEPTFLLSSEDEVTDASEPLFGLPTANYFGVFGTSEPDDYDPLLLEPGEGTFVDSRPVRLSDLQRGTSNTIMVGERTMARVPGTWLGVDRQGADAICRLVGNAETSPQLQHVRRV